MTYQSINRIHPNECLVNICTLYVSPCFLLANCPIPFIIEFCSYAKNVFCLLYDRLTSVIIWSAIFVPWILVICIMILVASKQTFLPSYLVVLFSSYAEWLLFDVCYTVAHCMMMNFQNRLHITMVTWGQYHTYALTSCITSTSTVISG